MSNTSEVYSGMECLQEAAKMLGQPLDMVGLISATEIQPQHEHTSAQLAAAATDQKLSALLVDHVGNDQIEKSPYPLLIHVDGGQYSNRPDYWVLLRSVVDGKANLFNPSVGELSVNLSQLQADRRGEVIALSREPIQADTGFALRPMPIARYAVMFGVVLSVTALALLRRRPQIVANPRGVLSEIGVSFVRCLGLAGIGVLLAFACRVAGGQSLLPPAAAGGTPLDFLLPSSAASVKPQTKPPEISIESALHLVATDALFVDARDLGEFSAGHIAGAILCPADDIGRWHLHMAGIDPHRKIVVYCAEASCGKGEYVATFLLQNGFTDVCLYRDGWAKWTGPKEGK